MVLGETHLVFWINYWSWKPSYDNDHYLLWLLEATSATLHTDVLGDEGSSLVASRASRSRQLSRLLVTWGIWQNRKGNTDSDHTVTSTGEVMLSDNASQALNKTSGSHTVGQASGPCMDMMKDTTGLQWSHPLPLLNVFHWRLKWATHRCGAWRYMT